MPDSDLKFLNKQDIERYREFSRKVFGVEFKDISLLIMAFTHRSYVNEHRKTAKSHNERLEFLGDAVLELAVTQYLYKNYPDEPEGVLTNLRSALVRTESIGAAGASIGLEDKLRLSRGERKGTDRARAQILANCFEAVVGALYLDQGYDASYKFIDSTILSTLPKILETGSWMDSKSRLQEVAQNIESQTPIYKVLEEEGPDHNKVFTIGVFIGGKMRGKGIGPSKQIGQQEAATQALESFKGDSKIDNRGGNL